MLHQDCDHQHGYITLWDSISRSATIVFGTSLKLPAKVSGQDYLNFITTYLGGIFEAVFQYEFSHMFQHGGAIPHYNYEVLQWLSENYPGWQIGLLVSSCSSPACTLTGLEIPLFSVRIFENQALW
jgi:hypothetical protein